MNFKDMLTSDIHDVFLNLEEFAELRTVRYDGETYQDIPVVLEGPVNEEREQLRDDHIQGLHRVSAVLHSAESDRGGKLPRQGCPLQINNCEGGGGYFRRYYVAAAAREMGMLRIELEAIQD